jgi:hypothetical protein
MSAGNVKQEARSLVDRLPDDATWDDLMHEIYVRQAVQAGRADVREGKVVTTDEIRRRFGLSS